MAQGFINIRMDDALKRNFDYICDELGLSMSTAITIFAKKVCREKRLPFDVSIDPKFEESESTMKLTTKTKFKITLWPEREYPELDLLSVTETFDDLDEAFWFLSSNYERMFNKMREHEFDEEYPTKGDIPFYKIEFINPEYMYEHVLMNTMEEGDVYRFNNQDYPLDFEALQFLDDPISIAYGFAKSLALIGRICL